VLLQAALALLLLAPPSAVSAQEIARAADGTISVRASQVPLGRLLSALLELGPFEKIAVRDDVGARPVTLTLERVTVTQALVQALNGAGVDYVLGPGRLVIADSTVTVATDAAVAARQDGPMNQQAADSRRKRAEADAEAQAAAASEALANVARDDDAQYRIAQLHRALAPAALPIPPGAPVALPFPGPDGVTPIMEIKGSPPAPGAPFPEADPGPRAAATPVPRPAEPDVPPPIDASTRERDAAR
jgi:hypothetical protein